VDPVAPPEGGGGGGRRAGGAYGGWEHAMGGRVCVWVGLEGT
jgi:hypothetical protein